MSRVCEALWGAEAYPSAPGYKEPTTSRAAAERIRPTAEDLRARVLASIKAEPKTADAVADALGITLLTIRPRVSELRAQGQIRPKIDERGRQVRRRNFSGASAIVWEAVK